MPWNYLQLEIRPDDLLIHPMIGEGDLTREQAHARVQALLDHRPALAAAAATWRAGAKDDVVYAVPFTWTIYEYPAGQDPRVAALAWCEDMAATMRSAGMRVGVARLP